MTRRRRRPLVGLVSVGLFLVLGAAPVLAADPDLDAVRDATSAYQDVDAATSAGYGVLVGTPLEKCIDQPGEGAMGFHRVNGDLVGDTVLDPTTPEALLYLPDAKGKLHLLGVEYVVFAAAWDKEHSEMPMLLGEHFHLIPEPNRYELPAFYQLHAWVWKDNPAGVFESFNPAVKCPMPDTAVEELLPVGTTSAAPLVALVCGIVAARRLRIKFQRSTPGGAGGPTPGQP